VFLHVFPAEEEPTLPVGEVRLLGRPGVGGLPNELVRRGWGAWAPGDVLSARLEPRDTGLADPVLPAHTACSFLIDCEEPAVRELAASFRSASNLASDELVAFVSEHIEKKSYGRGFDVASVVATRKEGDCTEHATLLAALARSRGLPARVVLGLALVRLPGGPPQAFGHAWTEIYEQGRWTTQDAALHGILAPPAEEGTKPVRVDYLPLQVITDEGPGFGKQLLSGANVLQMRGVQVPSRSE
jgi:transglutaminase-like putative cysteine protease